MAVVLALPFTFGMSPVQGLATMIAVFVGGLSGGLMSGILTGIPGTPSSVATTFDGPPLTKKGQARKALEIALFSSVIGDTSSDIITILLMIVRMMTMMTVMYAIVIDPTMTKRRQRQQRLQSRRFTSWMLLVVMVTCHGY